MRCLHGQDKALPTHPSVRILGGFMKRGKREESERGRAERLL